MKKQKIDKNLNWRLLKKLYSIHSPSGKEDRMISFLNKYLQTLPGVKLGKDSFGNLYAVKGEAETYPTACCHIDQVQKTHSHDFKAIETKDIIFGYSPSNKQFEGLGADDKNGILICCELLRIYDNVKCAFFKSEEIGCVGSGHADLSFFDNSRFVIQCDRRGNSDLVTNISMMDLCSDKFIMDIEPERFGYQPTSGMMTDVEKLKEMGLNVSAINMSCGYYNPHSDEEITDKRDLVKCWTLVKHIFEDLTEVYPHEPLYTDGWGMMYSPWEIEDEMYSMLQQDPDLTPDDLYDLVHQQIPQLTIDDIRRIVYDYRLMFCGDDEEDNYCETFNQYPNEDGKETIENDEPRRKQKKSFL